MPGISFCLRYKWQVEQTGCNDQPGAAQPRIRCSSNADALHILQSEVVVQFIDTGLASMVSRLGIVVSLQPWTHCTCYLKVTFAGRGCGDSSIEWLNTIISTLLLLLLLRAGLEGRWLSARTHDLPRSCSTAHVSHSHYVHWSTVKLQA